MAERKIRVEIEISNANGGTEYDELPPAWDQMDSGQQRGWLARVESDFLADYAGAAASVVELDEATSEYKLAAGPVDATTPDDRVLVSKADLVACFAQETPMDFAAAVPALNRVLRAAGIRAS